MNKVIKKWEPISSALNIDEDVVKDFCEYAEHHSKNDQMMSENLLPLSLKLFSKIENIKTFRILNKPIQGKVYSALIKKSEIDELKVIGVNQLENMENLLMNEVVDDINKSKSTYIEVYKFVSKIEVKEQEQYIRLEMTTNFRMCGSREEKLKRILK
jgi:hypothetical protein